MTPADVLSIADNFQFCEAWGALSDGERHEAGPDGFRRYRKLRPTSGARPEKGNGEDHDPVLEAEVSVGEAASHAPPHQIIHWLDHDGQEPPAFPWLMDHWLSWHPTLLAGRGGIGKSLLVQQLGTALSAGLPTWCAAAPRVKVLYWACEDDTDQLLRRQFAICKQMNIPFAALGNFFVDARYGLENTLLSTEFGRPMWTAQIEVLRQQVNDLGVDVLFLDNIGHTFGANENVRHDVTLFLNAMAGLVTGRPFCPVVLGHPSKLAGSEYSGSTAWENAVRMRWYLDDKMPDAQGDPDSPPDPDYRVLAKRKTNYTKLDYVEFRFNEGALLPVVPEIVEPGLMSSLQKQKATRIILGAIKRMAEMGTRCTDANNSPQYLPKLVMEYKLNEGCTKREMAEAMRDALLAQKIVKGVVGTYPNRNPMEGLKLP